MSVNELMYMGGYAQFVWPAYGISIAVLAGVLWASLRKLRAAENALSDAGTRHESTGEEP